MSTPSSASMRAAYDVASSAVDILNEGICERIELLSVDNGFVEIVIFSLWEILSLAEDLLVRC